MMNITALGHLCLERTTTAQAVRIIAGLALIDGLAHVAVPLVIMHGSYGAVNRDFMKVRPAEALQLSIYVGKQTALQKRVIGEVDPRNDVSRVKSNLLSFSKEIIGVAVKHHLSDALNRDRALRDNLGGVKQVKGKFVLVRFIH